MGAWCLNNCYPLQARPRNRTQVRGAWLIWVGHWGRVEPTPLVAPFPNQPSSPGDRVGTRSVSSWRFVFIYKGRACFTGYSSQLVHSQCTWCTHLPPEHWLKSNECIAFSYRVHMDTTTFRSSFSHWHICLVNHWCVRSKSVLSRYTFKPISINDYIIYHTITLSNLEHVLIVNHIPYNETYRNHYQVRLAKTDRLWPTYSTLPLYDHVSQFGWQHLWITVPIRCDWKPNTSIRMPQLHFVKSDSQCGVYQNMPLLPKQCIVNRPSTSNLLRLSTRSSTSARKGFNT